MSVTGITLEMCQEKLKMYLKAEEKVLLGQAYNIDGKEVTRADLGRILKGIELWEERCRKYGNPNDVGMIIENIIPGRH
ncbi:hypothetical protein [Psychrilyobacter atlanticus]|uniref:hypothetical protein n=1 Tax=Psychrilyobacter atlanticus TaxID=271091 RepID=UPI0004048635|nr:hypothetical protein [Psychrilyobacter atlanticus]